MRLLKLRLDKEILAVIQYLAQSHQLEEAGADLKRVLQQGHLEVLEVVVRKFHRVQPLAEGPETPQAQTRLKGIMEAHQQPVNLRGLVLVVEVLVLLVAIAMRQ